MPYLVIGELNPLVAKLTNALSAKLLAKIDATSTLSLLDSRKIKAENIYYGNAQNEGLVTAVIDSNAIQTIIYVPPGLGASTKNDADESIVSYARLQLAGITHFLDAWRKTSNAQKKTLIFLSSLQVYGAGNPCDASSRLKPTTRLGAALAGVEAILHSYAVSYKLNIKIARLPAGYGEAVSREATTRLIAAIPVISSHKSGTAEIFHVLTEKHDDHKSNQYATKLINLLSENLTVTELDLSVETVTTPVIGPAARFLIFGANGWIGQQFVSLLKSKNVTVHEATTRPGRDKNDLVATEITRVAPSHVVSMIGRTHGPGCGNIDYLEGGPNKLRENVQDNLYAPWVLANLAHRFGLHFTYLGTGCLFEYNGDQSARKEADLATFAGNKYSVVKGFTDRTLTHFPNTLNARIRLPINDEDSPRNLLRKLIGFSSVLDVVNSVTYLPECLPLLANLALAGETGTINLVNPKPISFAQILEVYQEATGQKLAYKSVPPEATALTSRAHCILDTSRIEAFAARNGTLSSTADAITKAAKVIRIQG